MTINTIWYTRCPVPTAFSIAVQQGFLEDEFARDGITFRSLAASTDRAVRQSHFEHTQANSIRHGGGIPPLFARQQGSNLRILGLSLSHSAQRVLVRPESNIKDVGDLRGKRLAVPRRLNDPIDFWRATTLRGFDLVLRNAGLSFDDVILVDLPITRRFVEDATSSTGQSDTLWGAVFMLGFQRDTAEALVKGEVDAVFSQGANSVTLQAFLNARSVAQVIDTGDLSAYVNNQPFPLTISGSVIDHEPEFVARFVATVRHAAEWAKTHPSDAKRIIANETGLPEELVDTAYGPNVHTELDLDLSPRLIAAYQTLHDDILARGFLKAPVDLQTFIDPRPFNRATEIIAAPTTLKTEHLAGVGA